MDNFDLHTFKNFRCAKYLQVNQNMATVYFSNFEKMFLGIEFYGWLVVPG